MLLHVSRLAFWLAALAAALANLGRTGFAPRRLGDATPLTGSALNDAASMIEERCAHAPTFEAALHATARVLKNELGALHATVYRVTGADASHVRVSELIEAQPGFQLVEQRVHRQRSTLGQAIGLQHQAVDAAGTLVLPVLAQSGTVAVIELAGLQIGFDADALSALLALAQAQLSRRAEPGARASTSTSGRPPRGGCSARLGENA